MASHTQVDELVVGLTNPVGHSRHIVTLGGGLSTAIDELHDGTPAVEHPEVVQEILRGLDDGQTGSIVLRTFTDEISHTTANGTEIPVKEVRGWFASDGQLHPLDEQQMFSASCTDAATGEPIGPERGVRYLSAHPIELADR